MQFCSYRKIFDNIYEEEVLYSIKLNQGDFSSYHQLIFRLGDVETYDSLHTCENQNIKTLINLIGKEIHQNECFQNYILCLHKRNSNKEKNITIQKIKARISIEECSFESARLKKIEEDLEDLDGLDFNKFISSLQSYYRSRNKRNSLKYSCDDYIALKIIELFYALYKESKRFHVPNNNNLEQFYSSKKISLRDIDAQYGKYGLLTIDDNFKISVSNNPKVYDERIKSYLLIKEVPISLLALFKRLKEDGFIKSLALRPDYYRVGECFTDLFVAQEELERGEKFSLNRLGLLPITKLYNETYDNLWIVTDQKKNITFEELVEDKELIIYFDAFDEVVVTQVLHLEYTIKESAPLIKHIDHEYVFYTSEEYRTRQSDYRQKGNAKKRFKTFKIDKSEIPFNIKDHFILYEILEKYFKKTELLNEYFDNVLKK
jgi:hypothetical protein